MLKENQSYWTQEIAPAGNYFDVLGTIHDLESAKRYAKYLREQGYKARVVLRTDEVVEEQE